MSAHAYGLMAEYETPAAFLAALRSLREIGCERVEAYAPFPVEGMDELVPGPPTPMARIMAIAAIVGVGGGYFLQWFAARDFPLNVGGRPLHSWPAFIPVTFELTVLTTSIVGVLAFLWLAGFPRLDHPVFSNPRFARASQDRFFVCVRANEPRYSEPALRRALADSAPRSLEEVWA